ncbi:MAG TPA: rhodanese-like domain-containing protein [Steroidobacteraceae bacterium]|nr:rhodanese-like domain-containing protein [Steroidobacteraceae bacterium]
MERFLEYAVRHPLLFGGTVALALAVAAYEFSKARSGGQALGPTEAVRLMNQGALLLDVRTRAEFDAGHIIDARHVPQEEVAQSAETLKRFKDKVVITCCESGMRSGAAARVLKAQGFTKVVNLRGGLQAWRAENLPLVKEGGGKQKPGGAQ